MEDLAITLRDLLLRAAVVFDRMTTIQCNRGTPAHPLIDRRGELRPEEGREVPAGVRLNFSFFEFDRIPA